MPERRIASRGARHRRLCSCMGFILTDAQRCTTPHDYCGEIRTGQRKMGRRGSSPCASWRVGVSELGPKLRRKEAGIRQADQIHGSDR